MQTIFQTSLTPEQYAQQDYQRQVPPPENCPNCHLAHSLEALCYYHRYISTATALVLWIWVRRFWCRHCRVTVSCLPAFAQPYRLVKDLRTGYEVGDADRVLDGDLDHVIEAYLKQQAKAAIEG